MADVNPGVAANNWKGWLPGVEILLPGKWPDPSLKPAPPAVTGTLPGPKPGKTPGSPTPTPAPGAGKPGVFVDPNTGLPAQAPPPFPGAAPPGSLGAASPTSLLGSFGLPAEMPGEVPAVGGASFDPLASLSSYLGGS